MKILCTQDFPGDIRMLGSVAADSPGGMEFEMMPFINKLQQMPRRVRELAAGASAVLTCNLWSTNLIRKTFPSLPLILLPHNACAVKAHYWFQNVIDTADIYLSTGLSLRRKTLLLDPEAEVVDIPYPRLKGYREAALKAGPPDYDLVFACTAYPHYPTLMGIKTEYAYWHELIPTLAAEGFRIAVLRHRDDRGLEKTPGVDYYDQPNPGILFAGRAVVSDIASNGLIAAVLDKPVLQVIDRNGEVPPYFASHRGFINLLFAIGLRFGTEWTVEGLSETYPFGKRNSSLWDEYRQLASTHINDRLDNSQLYTRLAAAATSRKKPAMA
ncbi:MAG: hypothetical protein GF417_06355 [Candidatus Latescibacteria bacterium]|nr:hypothetical protein [bacterium]MBD3424040.1 hypothetical protein [Candidatus Latescibacterota bacterium]